jgi:hypothetical protein
MTHDENMTGTFYKNRFVSLTIERKLKLKKLNENRR